MAEIVFTSLASEYETEGLDGLMLSIRPMGGRYLLTRSRNGQSRTDEYPNRALAWNAVRLLQSRGIGAAMAGVVALCGGVS